MRRVNEIRFWFSTILIGLCAPLLFFSILPLLIKNDAELQDGIKAGITRSALLPQFFFLLLRISPRFLFPFLGFVFLMAATQEAKNDPNNGFYLHPGESPAMVLVTPHLDGSNYRSWSRAMKCALLSKNKFKFVNGEIPEPSSSDS